MSAPSSRALAWLLALCGAVLAASAAHAAWSEAPVRIAGAGTLRSMFTDGAGGTFVVWQGPLGDSLRLVRLGALGDIAPGWPASGLAIAPEFYRGSTSDGSGGAYVMGSEYHSYYDGSDWVSVHGYRAWRITADGGFASGWPATGRLLFESGQSLGSGSGMAAFPDGANGFYVTDSHVESSFEYWTHYDYVHVLPDGTAEYRTLASAGGFTGSASVVADGAGGLVASGVTQEAFGGAVFSSHSFSSGPQPYVTHTDLPFVGNRWDATCGVVSLPPGSDVLVYWRKWERFGAVDTCVYRLMRLDPSLTPAAGWPAPGLASLVTPLMGDGQGGAFFAIDDAGVTRVQRVAFSGATPVVLWSGAGLPPLRAGLRALDGAGGLFQVWLGGVTGSEGRPLLASHAAADGHSPSSWPADGLMLSPAARPPMQMFDAAPGRAIVAWTDAGADSGAIYAQLLADDAPVPVAASVVAATATPALVHLEWVVPGGSSGMVVERRGANAAWGSSGAATVTGLERLVYEDTDVHAGEQWSYRLTRDGAALPGSEATVRVPAPMAFALRGFVRNPSPREGVVEFTLPDAMATRLEVHDVAGRVLARRDVGALGSGVHRVPIEELRASPPGLVFLRLVRGSETITARGTLLR